MSEGSKVPRTSANESISYSEHEQRSIDRLTQAVEALKDIRDSVCKNLETEYSSGSDNELPRTVVTEREFPFTSFDGSILKTTTDPTTDPTTDATFNKVTKMSHPEASTSRMATDAEIDREIGRLRAEVTANQSTEQTNTFEQQSLQRDTTSSPQDMLEMMHVMMAEITKINSEMLTMRRQTQALLQENQELRFNRQSEFTEEYGNNYGRTERDIRNRRSTARNFMPLKEARMMIPEFDGTSRNKLQDFINSCTYAMQNINPADEESLTQAILFTKLRGKARQDFETRDIRTFEELKQQLEACYQTKQSTTHLQIEFNTLKQRMNESAYDFGQRVELLAMKLYDSMTEGELHSCEQKRTIQLTIQKQALMNYQIGLRDDIKVLVRSQRFTTLQEAINGASSEEKLIAPSGTRQRYGANATPNTHRNDKNVQCYKCGKAGHYGKDCRSSRYSNKFSLPKPEKPRVNTIEKFCNHCKKRGHKREDCWYLNGRPKTNTTKPRNSEKNPREEKAVEKRVTHVRKKTRDSSISSSGSEEETERKTASDYHVTHIKDTKHTQAKELLLVNIPMHEAKNKKVKMLYDPGSTISLIKLKYIKDDTPVFERKIALTGVTGHQIHTIGKIHANIKIGKEEMRHAIYVVRDDFPIDHEGILGIDFIRKNVALCDYRRNELKIGNAILKMHPHNKITLKPRSETIIKATTDKNRVGIVKSEEPIPGVYIGNCIVKSKEFSCPVSILNTTDNEVVIHTPHITLEKITREEKAKTHAIHTDSKHKNINSRQEKI